jgi:hypothetical protein
MNEELIVLVETLDVVAHTEDKTVSTGYYTAAKKNKG